MKTRLVMDWEHVILEVDDKRLLLDTGSPVSFGGSVVELGGRVRTLDYPAPISVEHLQSLGGIQFDSLVGLDVLRSFPFTLDARNGVLVVGDIGEGHVVHTDRVYPVVDAVVDGRKVRLLLDTGANIMYLRAHLNEGQERIGERTDFTTLTGEFHTDLYRHEVEVFGHTLELQAGDSPAVYDEVGLFQATNVDGILGMELLQFGTLGFDLAAGRVAFKPFEPSCVEPA